MHKISYFTVYTMRTEEISESINIQKLSSYYNNKLHICFNRKSFNRNLYLTFDNNYSLYKLHYHTTVN